MKLSLSLALALVLMLQVGAAFAHAGLVSETPADGASVAASTALTLTFSETVTLAFTGITLTAPDGAAVALGAGSLSADGLTLTVPTGSALPAGVYVVEWHALSDDGHKSHGSYSFTVK